MHEGVLRFVWYGCVVGNFDNPSDSKTTDEPPYKFYHFCNQSLNERSKLNQGIQQLNNYFKNKIWGDRKI